MPCLTEFSELPLQGGVLITMLEEVELTDVKSFSQSSR